MSRQRRTAALRVGAVLGVPVYVHASWLLFAVAVTFGYGSVVRGHLPQLTGPAPYLIALVFVVALLLSVFLHELGHAVVSLRSGIEVRGITLELLGGYTEMGSEAPRPRAELLIALAGPAVSLALGGLGVALFTGTEPGTVGRELAFQLALSNLLIAVLNLLPGLPLDGGRALRAVVWSATGDPHTGSVVAGWAGRVVAVLLGAGTVAGALTGRLTAIGIVFTVLVVAVLWSGASEAVRLGRILGRVPAIRLGELVRPLVTVATGTPIAEALRRAGEADAGGIMITDGADRPVGLVRWPAAHAVPADRRPWLPVDAAARDIAAVRHLSIDLDGEAVADAVRTNPAGEYLVTAGQDVVGVLRTEDLAFLLEPRRQRK
ncbi:site-2 protease family protein [Longispora sp. K20-0274]|uniref:site-2 protease family protein n=1 Tax=Longispora sp. K20-0274 TaxID=3088255 RepID=UPI00399AD6AD